MLEKTLGEKWDKLPAPLKSIVISIGGLALSIGCLFAAKSIFPETDFTAVQVAVTTALSGFIIAMVKELVTQ